MRLKKAQKEITLTWIAEGLRTDEINARAREFSPPFSVSHQQVDWYRKTRALSLDAIQSTNEMAALTTGLARREHRVAQLQRLASLMERDLFGGFLWTEEVKGVGSGDAAQIVEYELFNAPEVTQYRGVLDDIAKETGGRIQRTDVTSGNKPLEVRNESTDRALSALADAIGKTLSGTGTKRKGDMDSAERPAVGSVPEQGG